MSRKFIPAHPIAGKEKSGYVASDADLFANKMVVITPLSNNKKSDVAKVTDMWEKTGAVVDIISESTHDNTLASTSHLPHVLAFSIMDYLSSKNINIYKYAGSGFKDFSRIASGNSDMWADILIYNNKHLLTSIKGFKDKLELISSLIETSNKKELIKLLKKAKQDRDNWLKNYE